VEQLPISLVVLARDEEANLGACLESVAGWAAQMFVVDSGSLDRTVSIATGSGAQVYDHEFLNHRSQWTWALENLPIETEWVLGLDADQRVAPELLDSLIAQFGPASDPPSTINGFYISRRQVFRGRWIKHGGYYPKYLLKLFRRSEVYFDPLDFMDHHFYVRGEVSTLPGDIVEDNANERSIRFWVEKHNRYARLVAEEEVARKNQAQPWPQQPRLLGNPDQRVMWFKERWYRAPPYVRPAVYFLYRYLIRRGFLDGKEGFIFHFLQGFWYRLMIDINLDELRASFPTSAPT
jgi:glycosyltransferase involved in cell wall biosynthesis